MRNCRKWIAWLLVAATLCFCLAGCDEGLDEEGRKIINIWHYWDDSESSFNRDIKKAVDDYQSRHPDLLLSLRTMPENEYRSKLGTSFSEEGGKDIDIFAFWGGYQTKNLQDLGLLLPLDKYITDDIRTKVFAGGFSAFDQKDRTYALPAYSWVNTLYCNTELFEQHNIALPETLEDVVAASKTFADAGLTPLALGGEDGWQLNMLFEAILMRVTGAGNVSAFLDGKTELADGAEFQTATELFKTFQTNGVLGQTPTAEDAQDADELFLRGDAAMRLTGSWLVDRMESMDDDEFTQKIKAIPFPKVMVENQIDGSADENVGGYSHSFFVNNRTKHKEEAADLCIYLSEVLGNSAEENGYGYSAWTKEPTGETALGREVSKMTKDASIMIPSWDIFVPSQKVDEYVLSVSDVFNGKITTLEFLNKLKQLTE